jgi:hypothetical protein
MACCGPATSSTKGYAKWFFDDVQVGNTLTWNQYSQSSTPPPVAGSSAFSVMDTRHLVLILGTGSNPVTISAVPVWQRSTAHNIELGAAPHRPTSPAPWVSRQRAVDASTGGGRSYRVQPH